eukprot:scaffold197981_cov18-Tisochrysis_lutea.AAC.1
MSRGMTCGVGSVQVRWQGTMGGETVMHTLNSSLPPRSPKEKTPPACITSLPVNNNRIPLTDNKIIEE